VLEAASDAVSLRVIGGGLGGLLLLGCYLLAAVYWRRRAATAAVAFAARTRHILR
jgi:hypothetical protein